MKKSELKEIIREEVKSILAEFGGRRAGGYSNDPREIYAKYPTKCAETGTPIKAGEKCIYYPKHKEYFCLKSKQAREYYDWKMDVDVLDRPW